LTKLTGTLSWFPFPAALADFYAATWESTTLGSQVLESDTIGILDAGTTLILYGTSQYSFNAYPEERQSLIHAFQRCSMNT
jgi:hypothetical protein